MPKPSEPHRQVTAVLDAARRRLGPDGATEAALLLRHLLGVSRAWLHTWPEHMLTPEQAGRYEALVERRAGGEPLAYITGHREFWSLDLAVTPATLIPRPDTETLVEQCLARLPAETAVTVADLGTGSGAVALAIAHERPVCRVVATDLSEAALAVAAGNARRLGIDNVEFLHGRWFEPLTARRFALIASNPPYIPEEDRHLHEGDLPFEPRSALVAADHGLADLKAIVAGAPVHLEPGGWLLLEHGYDQGEAVRRMMSDTGFAQVETFPDLEERDRVTAGRLTATR
jgi:release factor glutamine methyltransferase